MDPRLPRRRATPAAVVVGAGAPAIIEVMPQSSGPQADRSIGRLDGARTDGRGLVREGTDQTKREIATIRRARAMPVIGGHR